MQTYRWGAMEMLLVEPLRADRAAENDPERIARVMALRKAIRAGTYHVSPLDIADRMLESMRWP